MDEKDRQIAGLEKFVLTLLTTIVDLQHSNADLQSKIESMKSEIDELKGTNKEIQWQLNQNSQNSSKPPSSDGYNKPNPKSQREKTGAKPGGQKGHPGSHMSVPHDPDEIKKHLPEKCLTCPHRAECLKNGNVFSCAEKRYVVEAEVSTRVVEHQSLKAEGCPYGEMPDAGQFPENVKAYVQYGDSFSVIVGLLNTYGAISVMRIHTILGSLFGVKLSTGTIMSMISKCADKVGDAMEQIRKKIEKAEVGNFDETGVRVCGKLKWVHNSSTPEYTYQTINDKRGKKGMEANGVLPNFHGVAVHDCFSTYWKYEDVKHAVCNAHILRELTGIEDNEPEHIWAKEFKTLLKSMKKAKEEAIDKGETELSDDSYSRFSQEYDRIMAIADQECPVPPDPPEKKRGRKKKGKERALIERLMQLKDAVCLFIYNFKVPFDNNQAERDVRNVNTKEKIAGCFRTDNGGTEYLNIMSFLSTGQKHNINVYDALTAAFAGNAEIVLQ